MKKLVLFLSILATLCLLGSSALAAAQSKSISQMKKLSEKEWLALLEQGETVITSKDGKVVGKLVKETNAPSTAQHPADVLDLRNWYLGTPVNTAHDGNPDNYYQPELATYSSEWMKLNEAKNGVVFKTFVNGATTSGSQYPRSELREMNGSSKAAWSNSSGTHSMYVKEAITKIPVAKPEIVSAQLHDSSDDIFLIKLSGKTLYVSHNDGKSKIVIDADYKLGTIFELNLVATKGHMKISYNGVQKADLPLTKSGLYWKAGSYCQSNVSKGDKPDAVCEVVIYDLRVKHE